MRSGRVIKHQQHRRSTAATSINGSEATGGKDQRHRVSFPDDYVTTMLQCPRCIIVGLTGPYGQDLSWSCPGHKDRLTSH